LKYNRQVAYAISVALASAAQVTLAADEEQPAASSGGISEVVVTAQRRAESIQDVPITVQAITGAQLKQLNVASFNDLLKYTPNVTFSGNGPGTGNIFMRGLGAVGSGNQSQSTTAPFPNVGVYLDDQSMQFPARNNDVYVVDMERVEVLEGPQGTLFGGGAQAGAIRYITNKPNFNGVSGEANVGWGITAGGKPNTIANGVFNLPLTDYLSLRAVVFTERRGGYIDNVPSTISYPAGSTPATLGGNPSANNGPVQGTDTNPIDYQGARLSALWKVNEDWDVLLQQNYQDMQADGYFYTYPLDSNGVALGKYQIAAFTPAYNKDRYESTSLTVNGKISDLLSVVYSGSYMVRHIDAQQDYSNYMRSGVGSYYACIGAGAGYFNEKNFSVLAGHPLQCSSAVGGWRDQVSNEHQSHELRLSTNADNRLRGTAGLYWEKFVIHDNMNFNYLGVAQCDPANLAKVGATGPDCLTAVGPAAGQVAIDPSLREDSNTAFGEDVQRGYKQRAAFISADFDIIPKTLTITGGARFYHYDEFEHGSQYGTETSSALVVDNPNGTCTAGGACGFPINLEKTESGHRLRGNLTWHVTKDIMTYYTYSEGFRPGGFNRTKSPVGATPVGGAVAKFCAGNGTDTDPRCLPGGAFVKADGTYQNTSQVTKPVGFGSDQLTNHEIGIKSEWFDHRLLVNVSGYVMRWSDVQLSLFDPVHLGNTTFDVNGPTYKVKGFEVQFTARLFEGFTLEGSSSINSAEQISAPCLVSNRVSPYNPTPIGQCVTTIKGAAYTNPYGQLHTRPAFSPPWMFNVRAHYDWTFGDFKPFAWIGASHVSSESNEPASFPNGNVASENPPTTTLDRYEIPGYTTVDGAIGISKDNWTAQLSGSNLTNEYGPTNISSGEFIKSEIPLRPRVLMATLNWKF
jgi:iron complex outermembrane receptor protein